MKTFILALTAFTLSFSMIACNKKKESSKVTRGTRGYNYANTPGQVDNGTTGTGWYDLENLPKSDVKYYNMEQISRDYLRTSGIPDEEIGTITGQYPTNIVIAMRLTRNSNGTMNAQNTRMGIVFWDDKTLNGAAPLTTYFGPEVQTNIQGNVNGSRVDVTFGDGFGVVNVSGTINGGTLQGTVRYQASSGSGQRTLGTFTLPVSGVIY